MTRRGWLTAGAFPALAVALAFALAFALVPATSVSAHAALESSVPAANAVLVDSPPAIVLDFDEDVEADLASIDVFDGFGQAVTVGTPSAGDDASQVTSSLPDLDDGLYAVVWRVTSVDGHAIEGAFSFSIGNTSGGDGSALVAQVGGGGAGELDWWYGVARYLSLVGLFVLVGSGVWSLMTPWQLVRWRRIRWLLGVGAALLVIGSLKAFAMFAGEVYDGTLASAFRPAAWSDALDTETGRMLFARMLLAIVAAVLLAVRRPTRWWSDASTAVAVALVVTYSASGHANSQDLRLVWIALDALHLGAAVLWLGGLLALALAPRAALEDADAEPVARRFSRTAMVAVAVVALTGVAQTLRLAGNLDDVSATEWGQLLLVKVTLVVVIVALGAVSRWLLQHDGVASIRKTVLVEALVGLVVVGLAAAMIAQPPRAAMAAAPYEASLTQNGVIAAVTISPGRTGVNEIHITVTLPGGSLTPVEGVTARVSMPSAEIPASPATLSELGPNHYGGTISFSRGGDWTLDIVVQVTASTTALLTGVVAIPD